jgi:hypothetical protein
MSMPLKAENGENEAGTKRLSVFGSQFAMWDFGKIKLPEMSMPDMQAMKLPDIKLPNMSFPGESSELKADKAWAEKEAAEKAELICRVESMERRMKDLEEKIDNMQKDLSKRQPPPPGLFSRIFGMTSRLKQQSRVKAVKVEDPHDGIHSEEKCLAEKEVEISIEGTRKMKLKPRKKIKLVIYTNHTNDP